MQAYLSRMFQHMAWADRRVIASLRAAPTAQPDAVPILAHMLAAEHVWLSRLQGVTPRLAVWPTLTLDECEALAAENVAGYQGLIDALDETQLRRAVGYHTSQGHAMVSSMLDILTQVITHGPYHRGQIARIIGSAGGAVAGTDFIVFAREAV